MPRPKSYDRAEAVEKACFAFWTHGYQALGVRELEQLAGINQFAIRSEFGGKEGLYLEALQLYADSAISEEMAPMLSGGVESIEKFLNGLVTPGSATSSAAGCLMVNSGIENARIGSPKIAAAVEAYWSALERHFRVALENEGFAGTRTQELARTLVTAVMGIHARNRSEGDQTAGRPLVIALTTMLGSGS